MSFERSGASLAVFRALNVEHPATIIASPNPQQQIILHNVEYFQNLNPDLVVAVGGGSTIDTAKLVRYLAGKSSPSSTNRNPPRTRPPLIAIPTTAGSGAEATHFAAMYAGNKKESVVDTAMRPDFAIVDSALTDSLPPMDTASTGLDALAQSIESIWSIHSTEATRTKSFEALNLAHCYLLGAVHAPTRESRDAMALAAHLSGQAIDRTFTTAPHALSYAFTARYGIPHGAAVALTIGPILEYNAAVRDEDCVDHRGPNFVRSTVLAICESLGTSSPTDARTHLDQFISASGVATRLTAVGVDGDEAISHLVGSVNAERLRNNPRRMPPEEIEKLLQTIR